MRHPWFISIFNLSSIYLMFDVQHQKCYRVTHLNISAKWSQIFTKSSAYLRIGLLSWLKVSVCVHVRVCTHRTSNCARNFGLKTNPHISGNSDRIFMKLCRIMEEVSRMHQTKLIGSIMWIHLHATCINMHACFYIWQLLFNSAEFGGVEENKSFLGGSNVYSHNDFHTSELKFSWWRLLELGLLLQWASAVVDKKLDATFWTLAQPVPNEIPGKIITMISWLYHEHWWRFLIISLKQAKSYTCSKLIGHKISLRTARLAAGFIRTTAQKGFC